MPAVSASQRRLFAIAEHHPEELHAGNKGLAKLSKGTLHDFAATSEKNLPQHVEHMADGGIPYRVRKAGTPPPQKKKMGRSYYGA